MLTTRIVSSLEKCFIDQKPTDFPVFSSVSMLKNQRLSFQILLYEDTDESRPTFYTLSVSEPFAKFATLRTVESVPVELAVHAPHIDDNYLRETPGLYPDLLRPLQYAGRVPVLRNNLRAVWVTLEPNGEIPAGTYPLSVSVYKEVPGAGKINMFGGKEEACAVETLEIEVIDALLPEQTQMFTQWFYCDCLAQYYHCDVWSEKHWEIIEKFMRTAVRNGINMILTPVHTPALDTEIGGERLTTQLVDVYLDGGNYTFRFDRLDRWVDLAKKVGIRYFEIAHFFTQWGAAHAPKIMATVNGEYKKIFGWETDSTDPAYAEYLKAFIPAFLAHMKTRGDDRRCWFHVSDEPKEAMLPTYLASKNTVKDLLKGYPIMDALSDFAFYRQGVTEIPVPSTNHIEPFIEAKIPHMWAYFCNSQKEKVANLLISMPLYRTRSIGLHFFRYDIAGFLHWGYNFYNNRHSVDPLNPYLDVCGGSWVPGGDTFSVYPADDGSALESIRTVALYEALEDRRAMDLASSLCGKEKVVQTVEDLFGTPIKFDRCAHDGKPLLDIRDAVNRMIRDAK